jgi:hypothetical protein
MEVSLMQQAAPRSNVWHALRPDRREGSLPLEATREAGGNGAVRTWTVRLPVRAERITTRKPIAVREKVVVHARPTERSLLIESDVRREVLRLELTGEVPPIHDETATGDDIRSP